MPNKNQKERIIGFNLVWVNDFPWLEELENGIKILAFVTTD